jgi:hypothetical protein
MNPFLSFLKDDLNRFISDKIGANDKFVYVANLNNITDSTTANLDNKVIVSIVAIEEDKNKKDPNNYTKENGRIIYRQPVVWVNLVLLFTFYTKSTENYNGIDTLAYVIQYFQTRMGLDQAKAVIPANFPVGLENVVVEMVTLDFEKSNYLWSMFGGKYHPSVIYKFRSIPIDDAVFTPGPAIQDTQVSALHKKITT